MDVQSEKREIKSFCDFCASLCEDAAGEHENTECFFFFVLYVV